MRKVRTKKVAWLAEQIVVVDKLAVNSKRKNTEMAGTGVSLVVLVLIEMAEEVVGLEWTVVKDFAAVSGAVDVGIHWELEFGKMEGVVEAAIAAGLD